MTGRRTGRVVGGLAALAAAATLTACVQVPRSGAVVEARPQAQKNDALEPYTNPPPPRPGATPDEIVLGFLDAMAATPLRSAPAAAYLTQQGQAQWDPQQVLAYGRHSTPRGTTRITLRLHGTDRIGADGQWQGTVPESRSTVRFSLARENGEWRIARAPNALILQQSFYDQNFQDASLYFFDPSGGVLVPEPVHVPEGSQLASSLVRSLLRGPQPSLADAVIRTYIPPGLSVGLSVPVDRHVAAVNLKGPDPGELSRNDVRRMLAQLAWTLRQDPFITAFTLTIAGRTITDATGAAQFSVTSDSSDHFDPTWWKANGQSYALRRGRLVSGQLGNLTAVSGPFGSTVQGIGPFAVNLRGTQVAGVTPDELLVGPVLSGSPVVRLLSGPGLLRPSWDFANRLWEIQNRPRGAVVTVAVGGHVQPVRVPGISGQQVRRFLVSRDGSRIVAVLRGAKADRIVASRIRYDADGNAIGATREHRIRWSSPGTKRIRDIGWTSPTTIAVLDQLSRIHAEVRILNVDGSMAPGETSPTLISGRVRGLATSPVALQTPYAVQPGALYDISQVELPRPIPNLGVHHLTYAG